MSQIMSQITELQIAIAKLQAKYDASTGRAAYKLGKELRAKQAELEVLLNDLPCMGDFDADGNTCPVID